MKPEFDVSQFNFSSGEFILVAGASGSGKTTLLRALKEKYGLRAGLVTQDVNESIVTDKVWHELAFGLENLGRDQAYIRRKVAEMCSFFGLNEVYRKKTGELSGGMKQLVLLASVMAAEPEILLLDEPTSQLDPIAAEKFISVIEKIRRELGTTVIIAEHRFPELLRLCDRFVICDDMRIVQDGSAEETAEFLYNHAHPFYASLPSWVRLYLENRGGEGDEAFPLTLSACRGFAEKNVRVAEEWLKKEYGGHAVGSYETTETLISLKNISYSYNREKEALSNLCLDIPKGKITALLGGNGSGKTTALKIIAGLLKDYTGKIKMYGEVRPAMPNQDPKLMFFCETVEEDLRVSGELPDFCRILVGEELMGRHPYDLSGGELERAALAKVLMSAPDLLVLDEPTKGMETGMREEIAVILRALADSGKTIVIATHDLEFAAKHADKCVLLFDGEAAAEGPSDDFFDGNSFYTTEGRRLLGSGMRKNASEEGNRKKFSEEGSEPAFTEEVSNEHAHAQKKLKLSVLFMFFSVLVLMPLTVWFGSVMLENRKYYFTAVLIMLELLIPAYAVYEAKKPRAIELVVMATMCALTVSGRLVFYMLPTIKPVIALVMVSGLAFGPLNGLVVGASSMLVSNIFFGQGPWTPWQMFVMGLIGLLSGLLGRNKKFIKNIPLVCAAGVFMTLVVFGGIMNPASIIMYEPDFNTDMIKTAYATGFPYDLLTAGFTAVFLALGTKPILKRCERVKRYF